jgi:hypothetical protein
MQFFRLLRHTPVAKCVIQGELYFLTPYAKICSTEGIISEKEDIMRSGNKVKLLIILLIPVWIFVRAQLIRQEGPRIVKSVENYKTQNKVYPDSLGQIGIRSILNPRYSRLTVNRLREYEESLNENMSKFNANYKKLTPDELKIKLDNIQSDEFNLMYSIFVFARWSYDSHNKKWKTLD